MKNMKENTKKTARILLRANSTYQSEMDESLSIQRELIIEEVKKHQNWILDSKEYLVGNNVGDKDSVTDRNVLQEALRDAENREYDILVSDKDDQLGRRMLEIPMNIMSLKQFGVDVYTVKDGLLTPDEITIIDRDVWEKVQISRQKRGTKYQKQPWNEKATVISRNDGQLALIDVAYCGYCGRKLTNGTKYDYWTIKGTGERRSSQKSIYKCQNVWQGVPHEKMKQIRADKIEPIVFKKLSEYVGRLQEDENIFEQILENQSFEKSQQEQILVREKRNLQEIEKNIDILNDAIPNAITGTYPLSLEDLAKSIERQKDKASKQKTVVEELETNIKNLSVSQEDWENLYHNLPTWQDIFMNADVATKRVLVNKLIERIDITDDTVVIHFKVDFGTKCF